MTESPIEASTFEAVDFVADSSEPVHIEAATLKDATPTFRMVAYTGTPMTLKGFREPVVVDFEGRIEAMDVSRPILLDHDFAKRVGHSDAIEIRDGKLHVRGFISARNQFSKEVTESGRSGFPWQASIGATVLAARNLPTGKSEVVNGTLYSGPLTIATHTRLREISFVSLGADENTSARIDAQTSPAPKGSHSMPNANDTAVIDPIIVERKRVTAINRLSNRYPEHSEIIAKAIDEGWDENQTDLRLLKASTPVSGGAGVGLNPAFGRSISANPEQDILAAGIMLKLGQDELAVKSYGERSVDMAKRTGCRTLLDICAQACRMEIGRVPDSDGEIIRATFSSTSLPTALANVAEKSAATAFLNVPGVWSPLCKRRPVSRIGVDHVISRVLFSGDLEPVGNAGEIKHGTVNEGDPRSVRAVTKALMLSLTREDIINDDLSVFADTSSALGRRAAETLNNDFSKTLLANAGSFFHVSNENLGTGGGSALSFAGLSAAITAMRKQTDSNDDVISVEPAYLLVPPELEFMAKQLIVSSNVDRDTSSNDQRPTGNPLANSLKVLVDARLSSSKFAGSSATAWYLFSHSFNSAVLAAFLHGKESPTVETDPAPFHKLGVQYRVYTDYGFALGEPAAAYKATGA